MKALIIIDYQNSFADPKGSLYVQGGETIKNALVKRVNHYLSNDLPVILTRDWHPKDHCSFKSNGGQWPEHCVQYTLGAKYYVQDWGPFVNMNKSIYHLMKAYESDNDSYSAFGGHIYDFYYDINNMTIHNESDESFNRIKFSQKLYDITPQLSVHKKYISQSFADFLKEINVDEIEVCGLALDYCVKSTAIDGILNGFKVNVNVPLTKSVFPDNDVVTVKMMTDAGVTFNIENK